MPGFGRTQSTRHNLPAAQKHFFEWIERAIVGKQIFNESKVARTSGFWASGGLWAGPALEIRADGSLSVGKPNGTDRR
jgi:hypothetical protein